MAVAHYRYYLENSKKDALQYAFFGNTINKWNSFLIKINVTIREEMGRDIDGACGQLRRRHIAGDKEREV